MSQKTLNLDLLNNAIDSLAEAIIKYNEGLDGKDKSYKYAILNLSHFIELSFKYFLTQIHPLLIYKKPYENKLNREKTISMWEAVNFFKHANEQGLLTYPAENGNTFISDLDFLKDIRNKIEHHEFTLEPAEFLFKFGKILSVLDKLYRMHKIELKERLPRIPVTIIPSYNKLIDDYKIKILIANKEADNARRKLDDIPYDFSNEERCPKCGRSTYVLNSDKNIYLCTFCPYSQEAVECEWCNKKFPKNQSALVIEDTYFCSDTCVDYDFNSK